MRDGFSLMNFGFCQPVGIGKFKPLRR